MRTLSKVAFRKDDNAFLSMADPDALQAAANELSAATIEKRLTSWSWLLGPGFSDSCTVCRRFFAAAAVSPEVIFC